MYEFIAIPLVDGQIYVTGSVLVNEWYYDIKLSYAVLNLLRINPFIISTIDAFGDE